MTWLTDAYDDAIRCRGDSVANRLSFRLVIVPARQKCILSCKQATRKCIIAVLGPHFTEHILRNPKLTAALHEQILERFAHIRMRHSTRTIIPGIWFGRKLGKSNAISDGVCKKYFRKPVRVFFEILDSYFCLE